MDWDHYFHLQTIHAWLDDLAVRYKNIVTIFDIGKSYEGLPLKGIKLSHKSNNTAVFIEGGIHAREWISPATTTFILNQLLTSTDKQVQDIAQNWDWFFFPVINPDGYTYTFEKDRMWRKTRQPVGLCRGTDLNRNWNAHWNGNLIYVLPIGVYVFNANHLIFPCRIGCQPRSMSLQLRRMESVQRTRGKSYFGLSEK